MPENVPTKPQRKPQGRKLKRAPVRISKEQIELDKIEIVLLEKELQQKQREVWLANPVRYAKERLGIDLWDKQAEASTKLAYSRRVAIYSANGIGKTLWSAVMAIWWLNLQDENAIVFITGSNWHVIENVLLPEIIRLIKKNNVFPLDEKNILLTKMVLLNGNRLIARASDNPEGLQGIHTKNMLTICEETSGMAKANVDAIEGNATGENNRNVYLGNPLTSNGTFYDICMSTNYPVISISAFEHPNVIQGAEIIPGAVTRQSVEGKAKDECIRAEPNSPGAIHLFWLGDEGWFIPNHVFTSRVLGKFPDSSIESLISRSFMEIAAGRPRIISTLPALGCDPARFGDDKTVLSFAHEHGIEKFITFSQADQMKVTGEIMALRQSVSSITIDVGMGVGIIDRLREQSVTVTEFNFGSSSNEPEKFADLATEAAWKFKEAVESDPDFFIPNDAELIQEASERKYLITSDGRKKLESKREFKKRLKRSPDKFDAAILSFYGRTHVVTRPIAAKPAKPFDERQGLRYFEVERNIRGKYD